MIHVLFVPGMFGSTVEHVLRSYTEEYTPTNGYIDKFGALHTYDKEFHPTDELKLGKHLEQLSSNSITTPIYPFLNKHLPDILNEFEDLFNSKNKCILIHAESLRDAELNILFQYHKISIGLNKTLSIFYKGANKADLKRWNYEYNTFESLKPWEFREWFSLFYPVWVQEWIKSKDQVEDHFLKISNYNILLNPEKEFKKIINFCKLKEKPGIASFSKEWKKSQQYILDEYTKIENIINNTLSNTFYTWEPMSIMAQSMVQQKFRTKGYEIRCFNLNEFPNDSETLYKLLEKV
jgi:hypothetical protein